MHSSSYALKHNLNHTPSVSLCLTRSLSHAPSISLSHTRTLNLSLSFSLISRTKITHVVLVLFSLQSTDILPSWDESHYPKRIPIAFALSQISLATHPVSSEIVIESKRQSPNWSTLLHFYFLLISPFVQCGKQILHLSPSSQSLYPTSSSS